MDQTKDWSAELVAHSGLKFYVRPARPADEPALAEFFKHVTPEDLRFRFLSSVRLGHEHLAGMTDVDHRQTESFLAFDAGQTRIIATAMLACDAALEVGEVAISVGGEFKNRGVGWELLGYLTRYARAKGVKRLQSLENRANKSAIQIEREYGFRAEPYPEDPALVMLQKPLQDADGSMLSDVFVPLLTYPDATPIEFARGLPDFLARFAWSVTFAPVEIDVPDLANRWGASLIALPQMIAQVEANSRQLAEQLRRDTDGRPDALIVNHQTIRAAFGDVASALLPEAKNRDLAVVAIGAGSDEKIMIAEGLIFGTGRPVMVVPEVDLAGFDLKQVAIGWDGERCASRAVFDAMPLLVRAEKVTILTAANDKPVGTEAVNGLVDYLARHGIAAQHRTFTVGAGGIGAALQDEALAAGAGLLVMGAYGHSRLREFILGGATRSVLNAPRLPILLSH